MKHEIVSKEGAVLRTFTDRNEAVRWAESNLPGPQDSNDGLEPDGWYIQVADRDRR